MKIISHQDIYLNVLHFFNTEFLINTMFEKVNLHLSVLPCDSSIPQFRFLKGFLTDSL